ncbi:uncharacterized protein LOC127834501 [Dreissena polymorpha]|uniref:Mab-21-like HhH/H2TH-like domain-containing protein n=1 Tax=Dreissena polymorpha TaxID=45954 RepID=A0A9D4G593_DREPO|nr:uncharacterized protein LOC127834501 [Dreissena polymorpha]KAH3809354.1 hypothetical protein DPMN_137717 [Dreissena polymorpha]
MTRLGYGEQIRRWRVEKYKEQDSLMNARFRYVTMITAGSKAEGLTCLHESDRDELFVLEGILCVEAGISLHTIPDGIGVYRMDTHAYSGHCRLLLERQARNHSKVIHDALCDNGQGDILLSSSLFLDKMSAYLPTNSSFVNHERAGPSLPGSVGGVVHTDRVWAIRCHCPSILQRWASRPRHWPSPVLVQKVVSLGANVTAVGFKESEYKHMEWRIGFNTGESELVNNLNDTQAKVYVMLKMIVKDVLRPSKKEITSYVMKNIVLWQAERNPQNKFYAQSFLHWLLDGLRALRTAIVTKQLSYYMIPERNLMAASGLTYRQQSHWVEVITDMMAEGPRVILGLPKIRRAIVASPEPMLWYSMKRMELEMLELEYKNRMVPCYENGVLYKSDAIPQKMRRRMGEVLMEIALRMIEEGCAVNDLTDINDRMLQ